MLVFEQSYHLKLSPVSLSLFYDNSEQFKQLYHFHPGVEIIYVHQGTGRIIIERDIYEVKPGTLLFIRPFQPHFLQLDIKPGQPYVRSLIKYEPDYLNAFLKPFPALHTFHNDLWLNPSANQIQQLESRERMESFLREAGERVEMHPPSVRKESIVLFIATLLDYLLPLWQSANLPKNRKGAFSPPVIEIMNWLDEHFAEEFHLDALAKAVHLSPNHVSHLFRKETGKTVVEYLTNRRLKEACLLLKTTTLPVQEIGERCGWPNFAYFCNVFKKNIGLTPKSYRKE